MFPIVSDRRANVRRMTRGDAQSQPWVVNMTLSVGFQVARYRRELGMTAKDLCNRCAELGVPISRVTGAKLENGLRDHVSVPEIIIFARALGVTPMDLIVPADQETIELFPGETKSASEALDWLCGGMEQATLAQVRGKVADLSRLVQADLQ